MPNYTVTVKTIIHEFWDVEADNAEDAAGYYWEGGTLLDTDMVDAEVIEIEEM